METVMSDQSKDERQERCGAPRVLARQLAETAARHCREERLARRSFVVPRQRYLPDEVRVRGLDPVVILQNLRQAHHASFAANAADLDRLGANHAGTLLVSTR